MPETTYGPSSSETAAPHTEIRKKATTGLGWQAFNTIVRQCLTFLTGVVLARLLAPTDFGVGSIAMVFVTWIGILGDAGIGASVIQREHLSAGDKDTAFWVSGTIGLFSGICLFLLTPAVSRLYHSSQLRPVLYLYSASLLLGGLHVVPAALLRRALDFRRVSIVEISGTLISCLASVFLASRGAGAICFPFGGAAGLFISLMLYWLMGIWRVSSLPSKSGIRRLGSFTVFASGARIAELVRVFVDNALIGKFLGAAALGYYSLSYNLSAVPEYRVVGLITSVAFPALASLQGEPASIRRSYLRMLRYTPAMVLPALVGLMLVSDRVVPLVYGTKWLPAVPVLRILCVAGIGCSMAVLTDAPLLAMGRADWTFRFNVMWTLLLAIGLTVTLSLGRGLLAAAWVVAGASLFMALLRHNMTARLCSVSGRLVAQAMLPAAAGVGVMAAVVFALQTALQWPSVNPFWVMATIVTGGTAYLRVVLWLLPEVTRELVQFLKATRSRMSIRAA